MGLNVIKNSQFSHTNQAHPDQRRAGIEEHIKQCFPVLVLGSTALHVLNVSCSNARVRTGKYLKHTGNWGTLMKSTIPSTPNPHVCGKKTGGTLSLV